MPRLIEPAAHVDVPPHLAASLLIEPSPIFGRPDVSGRAGVVLRERAIDDALAAGIDK
jgi:hypothetical protein